VHGDDDGEYEGGDGDDEDFDDYLRDMLAGGGSADDDEEGAEGRGLHSFPFQPNLSASVHRITQLNS
jgi:hypothetical protein